YRVTSCDCIAPSHSYQATSPLDFYTLSLHDALPISVIANQWRTSVLKYRISEDYINTDGTPEWQWQVDIHVKPGDKTEWGIQPNDSFVASVEEQVAEYETYLQQNADQQTVEEWKEESQELISKSAGKDMVKDGLLVDK